MIISSSCSRNYRVNTGRKDMDKYLEIEAWGEEMWELYSDLTPASYWNANGGWQGSNECNAIYGSDGTQFPPGFKKEDKRWIFVSDLCRSMYVEFRNKFKQSGVPLWKYWGSPKSQWTREKQNIGFCMEVEPQLPINDCAYQVRTSNRGIFRVT